MHIVCVSGPAATANTDQAQEDYDYARHLSLHVHNPRIRGMIFQMILGRMPPAERAPILDREARAAGIAGCAASPLGPRSL